MIILVKKNYLVKFINLNNQHILQNVKQVFRVFIKFHKTSFKNIYFCCYKSKEISGLIFCKELLTNLVQITDTLINIQIFLFQITPDQ